MTDIPSPPGETAPPAPPPDAPQLSSAQPAASQLSPAQPAASQLSSAQPSASQPPSPPPSADGLPRWRKWLKKLASALQTVLLLLGLLAGGALFLQQMHTHYPVQHWLFWRYAEVWGWSGVFALSAFSLGNLATDQLLRPKHALRERLVYACMLGVLAFFLLMFIGGVLQLYSAVFAVALPLLTLAVGARSSWRRYRRAYVHLRGLQRRSQYRRPWWHWLVLLFGAGCVGLVYFSILSPRNVAFDSHFYHLALAQQYAVEGGIKASHEGWMPAAMPHLSSVLYSWCLLLPRLDMFSRIVCAAHLEFVIFLFTLAGIGTLVRRLLPKAEAALTGAKKAVRRPSGTSWVAMFLFPGILLYDSSLSVAADHITALFAVPIYLALMQNWRRPSWRNGALLAAALAGAILCKYQAMYLMAAPIVATALRCIWLVVKSLVKTRALNEHAKQAFLSLSAAALFGLILTSPHWLKNWIWYENPFFPYLQSVFRSDQYAHDSKEMFDVWLDWQSRKWTVQGPRVDKLVAAGKAMFQFSFVPHDWPKFHGKRPVFGSLFTLSLLVLPFLRGAKRNWGLVVATHLGVFIWHYTLHQDRYLQALLPWMACSLATTLALIWRLRWYAKGLASMLVALQVIWGGDVYFLPSHAMTGASPAVTTSALLAMGHKKQYSKRNQVGGTLFSIGRSPKLPQDAKVLIHENNPRLGLWRPVVGDIAGWQYALRYELEPSPETLHKRLRQMGVTHILARAQTSKAYDSLGADLRFYDFIHHDVRHIQKFREFTLYELRDKWAGKAPGDNVAYLGCGRAYQRGFFRLSEMTIRDSQLGKKTKRTHTREVIAQGSAAGQAALTKADYAVTNSKCSGNVASPAGFVKIGTRKREQLWARIRPRVKAAPKKPARKPSTRRKPSPRRKPSTNAKPPQQRQNHAVEMTASPID